MLACTTCTSKKTLALLCTSCSGTDNLTGHKSYVQNGKLFGIFKKLAFIFNFWTITNCAKNFEINVWEQLQWVPEYFFFSPLSQEHLLKPFWELTQRALTGLWFGAGRISYQCHTQNIGHILHTPGMRWIRQCQYLHNNHNLHRLLHNCHMVHTSPPNHTLHILK